jgi:16S rRNA (adenine1518-N6/adenine1519-N6)-dimethyltransferase
MEPVLNETAPKATVHFEDALKANLIARLEQLPAPRGIVSNMPYYITGPLLERIEGAFPHFDRAILMMQKEVGDRILSLAGDSDRGALSVAIGAGFHVRKVVFAPGGAFYPPPKVDSIVLELRPKEVSADTRIALRKLLSIGFAQRRKTLENNLAAGYRWTKAESQSVLSKADIPDRARPQELTEADWFRVLTCVNEHRARD